MCRVWEISINDARNEGISQGFNQGISQGISQGIVMSAVNVAKKFGFTTDEAMDAVGIPRAEWDVYAPLINARMNAATM